MAARWYDLGVHLGIDSGTLDGVSGKEHQTEGCFRKTLTEWLENVEGPKTWKPIIEALESPPVGHWNLASKLKGFIVC